MNLVSFWQAQVSKWNDESKCDLCWAFEAPLIESHVNIAQYESDTECCVRVFFLRDKNNAFQTIREYDQVTGLVRRITCNKSFELLVVVPRNMGINNYNEIKGHDTDESNWSEVLYKLEQCLSCDANIDFCEILGRDSRITMWSARQVINYLDSNYCGYRLTVNFQDIV